MNWPALRDNCCPKCLSPLRVKGLLDAWYTCSNDQCDFSITEEKFNVLIAKFYKTSPRKTTEDNLSDLNNLGHEEVAEDFSDSPHLD